MVLFLAATVLSLSSVTAAEEWHTLFNGKDLTGWRANVMPEAVEPQGLRVQVEVPLRTAEEESGEG